jgi:hypothetical protein
MSGKPEKDFKVEYAKSGRASCKGCKGNIEKDSLRLGKMVPSPHFDGYQPHWHHVPCWFRKKKSDVEGGVANIEGFMEISFDDQKLIKSFLSGDSVVEPVAAKPKAKKGPSGGTSYEIGEYAVEVAKSGRSKCRECGEQVSWILPVSFPTCFESVVSTVTWQDHSRPLLTPLS